jgi:hypothetical protein
MDTETRIADVFNHEFQAHPPGEDWEVVMRSVAYGIAQALHPDSVERRNAFLDAANWSGLMSDFVGA